MDSGELVSHAFLLQVPHPPGFPAYIWLTHALVSWMPAGSIFWRASVGAAVCALVALAGVVLSGVRRTSSGLQVFGVLAALVLPLGFERLFWLYAITPDVFALHAATTAATLAAYLRPRAGLRRAIGVSLGFGLGLANHPSSVFLAPLWLLSLYELRHKSWAMLLASATALAVAALYGSLCLMHPDAIDSWGALHSISSLWRHAVRADYGVLQLDAHQQAARPLYNIGLLLGHISTSTPAGLLLLGYAFIRARRDTRLRWVLAVLTVYSVIFFSLANTQDNLILERFMLMPHIGLMCAGAYAWCSLSVNTGRMVWIALFSVSLLMTCIKLPQNFRRNDLHADTVIEDYAANLLRMPTDDALSVIVTDDDTRFNALRYVQNVLGQHPDTLVMTLGTALSRFSIDKLRTSRPQFVIAPARGDAPESQSFYKRVMWPNREQYTFYFTPNAHFTGFYTRYLGLGRALGAGSGVSVDASSQKRLVWRSQSASAKADYLRPVSQHLYREYCTYFQASARYAPSAQAAQQTLEAGILQLPLCASLLLQMCKNLADPSDCQNRLRAL
jgi:hypothetical protein